LELKLKEKIIVAHNTVVFNFGKVHDFKFIPGQYLEWTLPHKGADSRGNRRYFSLSSSVNEEIQIAVRFHEPASSYKKAMLAMQSGDQIIAASLAGDFVMPGNINEPLVFVAGGIGVAPFRSIIQHVIDFNLKVDIYLLYSNRSADEIAFKEIFDRAGQFGVKTIYSLTDTKNLQLGWRGETGHFDTNMLSRDVPDYKNRTFYVSGPSNMVLSMEKTLKELGISRRKIKSDYFPGYA